MDTRHYQMQIDGWMRSCFPGDIVDSSMERNQRFLEEALELVQAGVLTREQAHALVDYVYDRPRGNMRSEIGGVMVCLAALCNQAGFNIGECAEAELERCRDSRAKIRAKHNAKPESVRQPF